MNFLFLLKQLFKYHDLRQRVLLICLFLFLFRVLANIPLPEIDFNKLRALFESNQLLGFLNIFSGGGLQNVSIALLGVGPYITAVIILQLLTFIFPRLKEMYYEEGEAGRARFNQYGRLLTVPIAFLQAIGFLSFLKSQGIIAATPLILIKDGLIVAAGTIILMWLGELITEQKLGNGISLIIFSGIVARVPQDLYLAYSLYTPEKLQGYLVFIVLALLIISSIVFLNEAEKRISIVFAKRVRGNKIYGGNTSYLPLRITQAGVMPIIFAIALLTFPQAIFQLLSSIKIDFLVTFANFVINILNNQFIFAFLYFALVFGFTYFYTSIVFNPEEISKNLQLSGAFIPGVRPGKETEKYLSESVYNLTFFGAIFLGLIAILPYFFQFITKTQFLAIGGTSILIVVSVAIETIKQINSELSLRKYEV